VLDIGCGWGGMAIFLAQNYDVHVTGITLSEEQLELARKRAQDAGVADKVRFELVDYRDLAERCREGESPFDRIVSVGMFEHVGQPQFQTFFEACATMLAEDGVMLMHTIGRMAQPGTTDAFTRKYIFPGGYAPSMSETYDAIEKSGLWPLDTEIWRVHYAKTLAEWRHRFEAIRPQAVEMYDEKFARMWELYLSSCECVFSHGASLVFQTQLGRERDSVPLTRDYLADAKTHLQENESGIVERLAASTQQALAG